MSVSPLSCTDAGAVQIGIRMEGIAPMRHVRNTSRRRKHAGARGWVWWWRRRRTAAHRSPQFERVLVAEILGGEED